MSIRHSMTTRTPSVRAIVYAQQYSNSSTEDDEDTEELHSSLNVDGIDMSKLDQYQEDDYYQRELAQHPPTETAPRKSSASSSEGSELMVVRRKHRYDQRLTHTTSTGAAILGETPAKSSGSYINIITSHTTDEDATDEANISEDDEFEKERIEKLLSNPNAHGTPKVSITPPIGGGASPNNVGNGETKGPIGGQSVTIKGHVLDKSMPVNFNVGGTLFATSLRTICQFPQGLLYKIVEMQIELIMKDEVIFIDRNPAYFSLILDYLRTGKYCAPVKSSSAGLNTKALIIEAEFFKITPLAEQIKNEPELSRSEIIKMINSCYDYPRLRGLYLCKINFHGLDLNCASFEYSNLSECTFYSTLMTSVNLFNAKLDRVLFRNCKASNSTFSNVEITNSHFIDNTCLELAAINTNFSNSKLTGSVFSCSNFTGSNFKNAVLFGCDFTNCNLSNCDFTGAQVDATTNFSASILKNAVFENCNFSIAINQKSWKKPKSVRNKNKIVIPHV